MARPRRNRTNGVNGAEDQNGARPGRNITGPQSALTDFLASHNISARQIRDEADQRRQRAAQESRDNGTSSAEPVTVEAGPSRRQSGRGQADKNNTQKKKQEQKMIAKIKDSKSFKKRKRAAADSDGSDFEDALAQAIFDERHAPLPGQMENCAICDKRFTVTPYSVAGPDGGLLCAPCGKEIAKERQNQPKKKAAPRRQTGGVGSRRTTQSRILDGHIGTQSLASLCVQKLAKNVDMAESLGDLPEHLVDKIARICSKHRLVRPETLPLFVQPHTETLHIYDAAKLGEQDLMGIFQVATNLRDFKARWAIQFKDNVMDYLLSRDIALEKFYLDGANLLSEAKWQEFFVSKGNSLKCLQVYHTDRHFSDETLTVIGQHCPNLARLKVEGNQMVTDDGVKALAEIPSLEHLGLQLHHSLSSPVLSDVVTSIGANLRTLSLKMVPKANDHVLAAINSHCRSLSKLRITESEAMTDAGFVKLFSDWKNPPLQILDLQKCRYVDAQKPRDNSENVGLCSAGFKALMAHSGSRLRDLNVHACRHISREAFEEVFHENAEFPELRHLEISFCEEVTDFVLGSIFRACPNIREVNVFGCMKVKHVRVPRGVILVGVPNAQGMVTEGNY